MEKLNSIFETPYAYYIGSAYGIVLLSCFIFLMTTLFQSMKAHKKIKSLEETLKDNDF